MNNFFEDSYYIYFSNSDQMNDELINYFKSLAPFSDEELENAMTFFKDISLKKNDFFVKACHYSDRIAYVKSGLLRSFFKNKDKEITTFFADKGAFVHDARSFLKQVPSLESIQALEDSELLVISRKHLYELYKEDWKWQQIGRLVLESYFVASEERTISLQVNTAQKLYEQFLEEFPEVVQKVPQIYIASYLGITPETLSRIRKSIY